jgi:hypothetical protein
VVSENVAFIVRRAADMMRTRAKAATDGPWWSDQDDQCYRLHGVAGYLPPLAEGFPPVRVSAQILKAPKEGTPYAEYWPTDADDAYITSMHPLIAIAVADAWDECASQMDLNGAREVPFISRHGVDPGATLVVNAGGIGNLLWTAIVKAARVYIGEEPDNGSSQPVPA